MKLCVMLVCLAVTVGMCVPASAIVGTHDGLVWPGWNLLALDGVPTADPPSPVNILPGGLQISNLLYRYDAATQSQIRYDEFQPDLFGNMLLGDGYWLLSYETETLPYSYQALNDTDAMDIWVSLPKAGWAMIGNPFSYNFPWENAKVTDGNVTVSMQIAAKTNYWLNSIMYRFDAEHQSQIWVGIPDDFQEENELLPKQGYWINSFQDKLALILEAIPIP